MEVLGGRIEQYSNKLIVKVNGILNLNLRVLIVDEVHTVHQWNYNWREREVERAYLDDLPSTVIVLASPQTNSRAK